MQKLKNRKIILIGLLFAVVGFFVISNFAFADDFGLDATKNASGIKTTSEMNTIEGLTSRILGTVLTFLSLIFFGLIVYGGGRWMFARGNSDEISKAQDTVIMAVIGLIIILGANALVNFVFTSVGTGKTSSGSSTTLSCAEAHPGWEVLPFRDCAGNNYNRDVTDLNTCTAENNCDYLISGFDVDTPANSACCLPYKSKCARSYEGYDCVADKYDCDIGTTKRQIGLCDSDKGDEEFCCQSSEVWCLMEEKNDEGDVTSFDCQKQFGQCTNDSNELLKKDYNFENSEECRQKGEFNAKISNIE